MNENSKEQETESRPEDAQASEQVKAVSGCDRLQIIKNLNVHAFIDFFKMQPDDLRNTFKLDKRLSIDANPNNGCFNCWDKHNQHLLPSGSWTMVQYCWKCNHINLVIISDRMGGNYLDIVECYTDHGR